ncbi:MAG TPA: Fic family protein [Terriglobales bacterium]|nr:Fic family protein [Terriglobales bacterium]
MSSYWPDFAFDFTLDASTLRPYIAAIEACKPAASLESVPPQWHEKSVAEAEANLRRTMAPHKDPIENELRIRKLALVLANAGQAHKWVKQRFGQGNAPMCLEDILRIHQLVTQDGGIRSDAAGVLRKRGRQVITGSEEVGFHRGAPASMVSRLMARYIRFINEREWDGLPPIIHALLAHFFIAIIHPFEDGNGRVARLVSAGILFQRGYKGHGHYAVSHYYYQNEEQYHRTLARTHDNPCPDLTEFFVFGIKGFLLELQDLQLHEEKAETRCGASI